MKQLFILWLVLFILLGVGSCKDAELDQPQPATHDNFDPPVFTPTGTMAQTFINDQDERTIYVGDEFIVKLVLYNMPGNLYGSAIDSLPLALSNETVSIINVTSSRIYFASDSKSHAICLKNPQQNYVMFSKMLNSGELPATAISSGVILKLKCKALASTSGFVDLFPASILSYWTGNGNAVSATLHLNENTLPVRSARIRISDEFYVP